MSEAQLAEQLREAFAAEQVIDADRGLPTRLIEGARERIARTKRRSVFKIVGLSAAIVASGALVLVMLGGEDEISETRHSIGASLEIDAGTPLVAGGRKGSEKRKQRERIERLVKALEEKLSAAAEKERQLEVRERVLEVRERELLERTTAVLKREARLGPNNQAGTNNQAGANNQGDPMTNALLKAHGKRFKATECVACHRSKTFGATTCGVTVCRVDPTMPCCNAAP